MNDDDLKRILLHAKPEIPDEPGFQRSVWQRIQHTPVRRPFREWLEDSVLFLTTPQIGLPVSVAVIVLSALLAVHHGKESRDETWGGLAASYERSIAPDKHINPAFR